MAQMASPYAAPNTPIASSKRPRASSSKKYEVRSLDIASPVKLLRYGESEALSPLKPPRQDGQPRHRPVSMPTSAATDAVQATLFSPVLMRSEDSEDEGESDAVSYPTTPSKSAAQSPVTPPVSSPSVCSTPSTANQSVASKAESEDDDVFNPYVFIANLPPHSSIHLPDKICLPPSSLPTRPTLVLDLDETLVHCTVEPIDNADLTFPVTFNGSFYNVFVRKRPYLDYFLSAVSKVFEVVVFTASQKVYADVLLDRLDPDNEFVHHRLFREACVLVHGNYLKDLTVLGRDLSKTVLVDNSPHAYGFQVENGIPIESWFDDETDTELLKLVQFLKGLHRVTDVRDLVRSQFRTYELLDAARKTHLHRGHA